MDAVVVRFTSDLFDVSKEPPNAINPIYGHSILAWLAEKWKDRIEVPKPQTEDWGWYVDVEWQGRGYMIAAAPLRAGAAHEPSSRRGGERAGR